MPGAGSIGWSLYVDGQSHDPTQGSPHVFWDEAHAFIAGAAVAPGSIITLQKDAANAASYYNIDLVELETPPAPLPQPVNSLSTGSASFLFNTATKVTAGQAAFTDGAGGFNVTGTGNVGFTVP